MNHDTIDEDLEKDFSIEEFNDVCKVLAKRKKCGKDKVIYEYKKKYIT